MAPPPWRSATVPLRYDFPVDRLVRALKFRGDFAAGSALAIAMKLGPRPPASPVQTPWLVPVPLHWSRELRRGFNQATELALSLSRATGWPMARGLVRSRRTSPQTGLDAAGRKRNLERAFRWKGPSLVGRHVVLVDDVLTTGATASACAAALGPDPVIDLWMVARALPDRRTASGINQPEAPSVRDRASVR